MYRRTRKYQARHQRQQLTQEDQRPATWQPTHLRRRITIDDFDSGELRTHVVELYRTTRIDSYRAVVDGVEWQPRIGWSRVLDGMRRALPRLLSARHAS